MSAASDNAPARKDSWNAVRWGSGTDGRSVTLRSKADSVNADGSGDIFDAFRPQIFETEIEFVAHLVAHNATDADGTGIGKRLEAGGEVDAIAIDIVAVNNDVAEVDANPEFDAFVGGGFGVPLRHSLLH